MRLTILFVAILPCLSSGGLAQGRQNDWKCDWFGWGCPKGEQNAVLLDLGRTSTNTGFLFFSGDSAVVERELEFKFSKRAIAKGDRMQLSVHSSDLPENTTIVLEGQDCLSPSFVEVVAQKPIQRVKLRWMAPPTEQGGSFAGTLRLKPFGFDRAGSISLNGQQEEPIVMLRLQGEVESDWHWAKRLTFWFWLIVACSVVLWKFILAPLFFYRRIRMRTGMVKLYKGSLKTMPIASQSMRRWVGARQVVISERRDRRTRWADFFNGRTAVVSLDGLGEHRVAVLAGRKHRRKGVKLEVRQLYSGQVQKNFVYSKEHESNVIQIGSAQDELLLHFEFE